MKRARWLLFIAYCLFIVWFAVLKREPTENHEVKLSLFWAYRRYFTGGRYGRRLVIQNLQNIVFFLPFGVLIPVKKWWVVVLTAFILSAGVEIAQYVGGYGLAELDDVICNVLGATIGFCLMMGLKRLAFKGSLKKWWI